MTSPTTTELGSLGGYESRGFLLDCRPTDQLFDMLPFEPIRGKELQISVVDASADGLSAYASAMAAGGSLGGTVPAITTRIFPLARIAAQLPIDSILPSIYGSQHDVVEALISLMVNAVRDKFKKLLIEGDTANTGEFDGLNVLANTYGNEIGADDDNANGGAPTISDLARLIAMIKPRKHDGNTYLVMSQTGFQRVLKNGVDYVEYTGHPVLGSVPALAGVPVLFNDFISNSETKGTSNDCTSIYAVNLSKENGLCGIYPAADEGQPIQVRGPVAEQGTDTQYYHVSWNVTAVPKTKCCIGRCDGVR